MSDDEGGDDAAQVTYAIPSSQPINLPTSKCSIERPSNKQMLNRACGRAILFSSVRVLLTAAQAYGDDAYNPEVQFPSTARSLHRGLGFYI